MTKKKIRWGILGAGEVVERWMNGARQVDDMELAAIASRNKAHAQRAADKYGIAEALTFEELIERKDIDIVYVAVPHMAHKELAIQAMKTGKGVLVEKPAGINAAELSEMIECAKENQVFFMEGIWTKFFPVISEIKTFLKEGKIGEVRAINTNFSFRTEDRNSRLLDLERAGGSLLDTGVYNLHFMQMIFEKSPEYLTGVASINTDKNLFGVDEQAAYIAQYTNGELGMMCSAVRTEMIDTAYIYGTKGYITIPRFWKPTFAEMVIGEQRISLERNVPQKVDGVTDEGYQFEIRHVNDCLNKGILESPIAAWNDSREVLEQCDRLRKQWGLIYPKERIKELNQETPTIK